MQNQNRVGSIYFHNRPNQNSTYKPLRPQQMNEESNMTCTTYKSNANLNHSQNSGSRVPNNANQTRYTLNSLWCIWYGLIVILFQVYIIIRNVQRFTSYLELPWPVKHEPFFQLNAYVVLTAIGVIIMPFFFVSTVVRIGNYSNDGIKLGSNKAKRNEYENDDLEANFESQCSIRSILASWWKHCPPMMGLLHFASAACFLSAHCLMEAELIKHGFLNKGRFTCFTNFLSNFIFTAEVWFLSLANFLCLALHCFQSYVRKNFNNKKIVQNFFLLLPIYHNLPIKFATIQNTP